LDSERRTKITKIDPALFQAHIRNEFKNLSPIHLVYQANAGFSILIDEAIEDMKGSDELFEFIRLLQKRRSTKEFLVILSPCRKNAFNVEGVTVRGHVLSIRSTIINSS